MVSHFARGLRKNPTDAGLRLWSRLRGRQIDGFRFRRQQPIGRDIADFFCPEAKLIVEADGSQHQEDDGTRTEWLEAQGYGVIRFWNNEVLTSIDLVVQVVLEALHEAVQRNASPLEGEVAPEGRAGGSGAAFSSSPDMRRHTPHPSPHARRRPPPQGGKRGDESGLP